MPCMRFWVCLFLLDYSFRLPYETQAWGFANSLTTSPFSSRIHGSNPQESVNSSDHPKRRAVLDDDDIFENGLLVKPIGVVQSIYRLCVGTPRQGLLAPHARGRLALSVEDDAVIGLDDYSHIWVVFVFHLNTKRFSPQLKRNKVSPPALGGKKVGVLSTRTPHRFNPMGMTLCKLEGITRPTKFCKKTFLEVTGLDLVDGTPILDIKPYVAEYDSVDPEEMTLPSWVSGGLSTRRQVTIAPFARDQLHNILCDNPKALDFYGTHRGDASCQDALENVLLTIEEVLSIDVRSSWQTNKLRKGDFRAERADRVQDGAGIAQKPLDGETPNSNKQQLFQSENQGERQHCTQQLDKLLISYTVEKPTDHDRTASLGSGAEDKVLVESIELLATEAKDKNSDKGNDDSAGSTRSNKNNKPEPKEKDGPRSDCDDDDNASNNSIEDELERLQYQLTLIEALEERNKAQIESFADEQHQWESLEEEERDLLQSKESIVKRLEQMTSELVQMWMGGKSMEG